MSDISRIEQIFLNAVNLADSAERGAYLDSQCGADTELRRRVVALLAAQPQAQGFLEPVTVDKTSEYQQKLNSQAFGTIIADRYTLTEIIGEGGMGTVWRAKQTEPVKRFVALKLIKPGMDSKQVLGRFEAERQALAMMDHPNIAKILDGGIHDNRPFFVMELVKGTPITEFCDARRLTPRERLELFLPVCLAIQHAHQKGIIHRDIKPSNVLIALYDDKPVPKVIDFGVAKATGGALTQQTIDTGFGGVVGTPQYMSPEQATFNNLDIDTRSDVYSLGTLLYELLAGSPPFARPELEKRGLLEILRVVREEEPPRPSMKLSTAEARACISANRGSEPSKLSELMRGEIDWIVMKALEKDRSRRYDTANGLAADVQRYLNGDAVEACPPTLGYRLRKAYRRNRTAVRVASAFFFLMVAAVTVTSLLALKATRAEAVADRNAGKLAGALCMTDELLQDIELKAANLRVERDLGEFKTDRVIGLLKLARTLQSLPISKAERRYELTDGEELTIETSEEILEGQKSLRELVSTSILANGQYYAPLLTPITHDGQAIRMHEVTPDGRTILTLGADGTARIWDSKNASQRAILKENNEQIINCGLSQDGRTIFTDDHSSVVRFWHSEDGTLKSKTDKRDNRYPFIDKYGYDPAFGMNQLEMQATVVSNGRSLTKQHSLVGKQLVWTGPVELWDTVTGRLITKIDSQKLKVESFHFSKDARWVFASEGDSTIVVFDARDGTFFAKLKHDHPIVDFGLHFTPDLQFFATVDMPEFGDNRFNVYLWDANACGLISKTGPCPGRHLAAMTRFSGFKVIDGKSFTFGYEVGFTGDESPNLISSVYRFGSNKPVFERTAVAATNHQGDRYLLENGIIIDSTTLKRIPGENGKRFPLGLSSFAQDSRFVLIQGGNDGAYFIDSKTEKQFPSPLNLAFFRSFGWSLPHHSYPWQAVRDTIEIPQLPLPNQFAFPVDLMQLWAQVAVRGELGTDGEFVSWSHETWEKKRQELAAAKSPYPDFPFPGYVAKDKLHWHRAEYVAAQDDNKKRSLVNELVRFAEESGDTDETVRWRTERAKYLPKPATPTEKK